MKKTLSFMLALVLIIGVSVPTHATVSKEASRTEASYEIQDTHEKESKDEEGKSDFKDKANVGKTNFIIETKASSALPSIFTFKCSGYYK